MNLLIYFTKTGAMSTPTAFIEDLIATCVMELKKRMSYKGRMMKWSLLSGTFLSFILHHSPLWHAPEPRLLDETHTKARSNEGGEEREMVSDSKNLRDSASPCEPSPAFLRAFASSCETSPLRSSLLRLTTDSPDLLAVIKQEGRV
jgi:hypothetical protein